MFDSFGNTPRVQLRYKNELEEEQCVNQLLAQKSTLLDTKYNLL